MPTGEAWHAPPRGRRSASGGRELGMWSERQRGLGREEEAEGEESWPGGRKGKGGAPC